MTINLDEQSLNAARMILEHPLTKDILDDMELSAINNAVNAKLTDKETPAAYLAEVRAIRNFRSRLAFIVSEAPAALRRKEAVK